MVISPLLYDRRRMAEALCISEDLLDRLVRNGLPFIRVPQSTKRLFDGPEVVRWMRDYAPRAEKAAREEAEAKADAVFGK